MRTKVEYRFYHGENLLLCRFIKMMNESLPNGRSIIRLPIELLHKLFDKESVTSDQIINFVNVVPGPKVSILDSQQNVLIETKDVLLPRELEFIMYFIHMIGQLHSLLATRFGIEVINIINLGLAKVNTINKDWVMLISSHRTDAYGNVRLSSAVNHSSKLGALDLYVYNLATKELIPTNYWINVLYDIKTAKLWVYDEIGHAHTDYNH